MLSEKLKLENITEAAFGFILSVASPAGICQIQMLKPGAKFVWHPVTEESLLQR